MMPMSLLLLMVYSTGKTWSDPACCCRRLWCIWFSTVDCFPAVAVGPASLSGSCGQNDDFRPLTYTLGGRGMGCRDKYVTYWTPASYESLPAPLATQIPTLWIHKSGGWGRGALILDRCRAFDLFASVDAHLCFLVSLLMLSCCCRRPLCIGGFPAVDGWLPFCCWRHSCWRRLWCFWFPYSWWLTCCFWRTCCVGVSVFFGFPADAGVPVVANIYDVSDFPLLMASLLLLRPCYT